MSEHIGNRLPAPLRFDFSAVVAPGESCSALLLATVDADGSPRLAVLAPAEVVVCDERRLKLAAHEGSTTCANLLTRPRLALWCVLDAAAYTIKGTAVPAQRERAGWQSFDVDVESVWRDFEPAAPMIGGPTYRAPRET